MRASYSKISGYFFCPKKYEFRYVLERPVPRRAELAFGSALHAALEKNFAQKIDSRLDLLLGEVQDEFRRALAEELMGVPEDSLRGATAVPYLRAMGEHFLSRFMTERAPALQPAPRGVECAFLLPLPGGHQISGKFDLMDTDWVLHDFKTSSKLYDRRRADQTQLVLYAWACQRLFGRLPLGLCFDVFVKGDGAEKELQLQDPVTFPVPPAVEMSRVAQNLCKQIDRIEEVQKKGFFQRSFEPRRCTWCEYQAPCLQDWEEAGRPAPQRPTMEKLV